MAESVLSDDVYLPEIRQRGRQETNERRKHKHHQLLGRKRKIPCKASDLDKPTLSKVEAASLHLKKNKNSEVLQLLNRAFSEDEKYINLFLSVNGALYGLIGCLTGPSSSLQLEAAACIVNLLTGSHSATKKIIKAACPYLVTYLSSSNASLQNLSAWGLANAAADCDRCSQVLKAQGMVGALVPLLQSPHSNVVHSAAFALATFVSTTEPSDWSDVANLDTLQQLLQLFNNKNTQDEIVEATASIFFHLSARTSFDDLFLQSNAILGLVTKLNATLSEQPENIQLTTLILRTLGNFCAGADNMVTILVGTLEMEASLMLLLNSNHHHVLMETMWVLANIAGSPSGCTIFAHGNLLTTVLQHANAMGELGIQTLQCLFNIACINDSSKNFLIGEELVPKLLTNLRRPETAMLSLSLMLLKIVAECRGADILSLMGPEFLPLLENLQFHGSVEVRQYAVQLLRLS